MNVKTKMLGDDLETRLQVAVLLVRMQEREKKEYKNKTKCMKLRIRFLEKSKNKHYPSRPFHCNICHNNPTHIWCDFCHKYRCNDCNNTKTTQPCSICSGTFCLKCPQSYICKYSCVDAESNYIWYCKGCQTEIPNCIKCNEPMIEYKN